VKSAHKMVSASIILLCLSGSTFAPQVTADSGSNTYVVTTGPRSGEQNDIYDMIILPEVTTVPYSSELPANVSDSLLSYVTQAPLETTAVSFSSPRILTAPATTTMPFTMSKPSQYYYGDVVYLNNPLRIVIFGITSVDEIVEIPSHINGKTVTTLGGGLFDSSQNVKTLYLPDTIDFINADTFLKTTKITDIYYQGTKEQWDEITYSDKLPEIEIHYNAQNLQYGVNNEKIEYRSNGKYIEIVGCPRDIKKADIPSEINGLPVTKIGKCAFEGCQYLENVTIPESVDQVGVYAFNACKALKNVYYTGSEKQWNDITWKDTTTVNSIKNMVRFRINSENTDGITGDLNYDKVVTASDVVIMQKYLLGSETPDNIKTADIDVNNDEKVNIVDLIILKQMFLS